MSFSLRKNLEQFVNNVSDVNQLSPLLPYIPLDSIKSWISQQIKELDDPTTTTAYFNVLPLDQILPDDTSQRILTYSGSYNTKGINNKWKQLSEDAETIYLRERYTSIDDSKSLCQNRFKFDPNINTTWIVAKHRQKLHPIEEKLGFKGPINNITKALTECVANDKILIHDGNYQLNEDDVHSHIGYSLYISVQLIGIAHKAIVKTGNIRIKHKAYFKNIKFESVDNKRPLITMEGKLRIEKCTLVADKSIYIGDDADIMINKCSFISAEKAIEISPIAGKVEIKDCLFSDCESSCIAIQAEQSDHSHGWGDTKKLNLKFERNIFDCIKSYPMIDHRFCSYNDKDGGKCVVKDNEIRGKALDANRLYHVIDFDCDASFGMNDGQVLDSKSQLMRRLKLTRFYTDLSTLQVMEFQKAGCIVKQRNNSYLVCPPKVRMETVESKMIKTSK